MSNEVKYEYSGADLIERVDRLNLCLTLLIQQLENVEQVDKGVLLLVKNIMES